MYIYRGFINLMLETRFGHYISIGALLFTILLYQNCGQFESVGTLKTESNLSKNGNTPGNKAILDCSKPTQTESTVLSRMTRKQIYLSLLDLIGFKSPDDLNLLPIDSSNNKGLRNDSTQQLLFPDDGKKIFTFFETVVGDAIARKDPKIFTCDINSVSCLYSIIDTIAHLALRGQPNPQIITKIKDSLSAFITAEEKLKWGLISIFLQPDFLFHESSSENLDQELLNSYKIADRLATLLWFSLPDEQLLQAAKNGELLTTSGLNEQVERMISDNKILRFTYNFSEQWLSLDVAKNHYKDSAEISDSLADALISESRALLEHVVTNDLPINELLKADYTFVNNESAKFYGLNTIGLTNELKQVNISSERRGLFSQAAVIAGMSEPGETNPTARGYWFLKRAFCLPPDPIPGNLMDAVNNVQLDNTLPMKARLERLSSSQACGDCHKQMDPIGIAFENFDSLGQLRTHNGPHPVDTSGQLIDGDTFNNSVDMAIAMQNSNLYSFESCFSHHLASLARAKITQKEDLCKTNKLVTQENMTFKEIIKALVTSDLFLR